MKRYYHFTCLHCHTSFCTLVDFTEYLDTPEAQKRIKGTMFPFLCRLCKGPLSIILVRNDWSFPR